MPKCGFCKQEVFLEEFLAKKKNVGKTVYKTVRFRMYCCPHCDSVIGFNLRS